MSRANGSGDRRSGDGRGDNRRSRMIYTQEQIAFLEEHYEGRYYKELAATFNEKFGTPRTRAQIGAMCYSRGWTNNLKWRGAPKSKYTPEQLAFLREHVHGRRYDELTRKFNQRFGTDVSVVNLGGACRYRGLSNGLKSGGHEGLRGERNPKYMPDGSKTIDSHGYVQVKVDGVWRKKHVMLWEEAYGPVPEGHYLVFGDGYRTNVCLDNLHCVTANEAGIWTMRGLHGATPELAQTGLALTRLYAVINERGRRKKKGEPWKPKNPE